MATKPKTHNVVVQASKQAPAMAVQRVFVPEVSPPASPAIVQASKADLAALRPKIIGTADPLAWAKQRIADHKAGKHVSGFALRSARSVLGIDPKTLNKG